jgi:hypothetical protein
LAGEAGSGITLHVREYADHLLSCNVVVRSGRFRAAYQAEIYEEEIKDLYLGAARLHEGHSGRVDFGTELRGLELSLVVDRVGRIAVKGEARDLSGGNRLSFAFTTDQSYLAEMVAQLEEVLGHLQ